MYNLVFLPIGTQEAILLSIFTIAGIAPLVLAIIALVDLSKREFNDRTTDKILLILLIVFAPFVGSILYYLVLRQNYSLREKSY